MQTLTCFIFLLLFSKKHGFIEEDKPSENVIVGEELNVVMAPRYLTKGKDSAKYLGTVTWNSIPSHIRQQDSLEKFCDLIKKWKPDCKCKLCKDYIGHIGYIQIVE